MLNQLPRVVFIAIFLAGSYLVEALEVQKIIDIEEPTNVNNDALSSAALPSQNAGNLDFQGAVPVPAPARLPPSEVRSLHQTYDSGNNRANQIKELRRRALESRAIKHRRPYSSSNYKSSRRRLPKSDVLNNPSPSSSPSPSNNSSPLPQKTAKDGGGEKNFK